METLLLVIVIVLLWVDLDEEDVSRDGGAAEGQTRALRQTRRADFRLKRLTDEAVLAMLDEARRYEPGRRP